MSLDKKFSQDWFSSNLPYWSSILGNNFKNSPELQFLEIGSFESRSACWLMENVLTHDSSRLVCVDTFAGSEEHVGLDLTSLRKIFDHNTREWKDKIEVHQMKSVDALPKLIVDDQKFDVIYVDGSHLACDVLFDAVNSFKLLKVGGLMIFDDYLGGNLITPHDVKPAVDAFVFSYSEKVKIVAVAYQYWVQKVSE